VYWRAGLLLQAICVGSSGAFLHLYKLTILHTNEYIAGWSPFPMDGGRNQGLGGVAARAELIQSIRQQEEQVFCWPQVISSRVLLI